ncbi:unnamed protein product [Adineta steineri]|uniref:Uncharacterized protein n=1 Tax=Adineta steineri TaxID=433720 RepID=A0A819B0H1_9BILA|nr:unnamed protein product [Adineta steineri]CAF0967332.1 unnamed protein product [Adineta steineri]CAF3795659.1 unnamed protein product [Adineta steineri]CAF3834392.1 unnamed protein product [Adineta steineri]
MNPTVLENLFGTDELCKYLNKMITKLYLPVPYGYGGWYCSPKIKQLCQIFSNLEQLSCDIEKLDILLFVIQNLSKLTFLHVSATGTDFRGTSWLEKETRKLGIKIIIEINDDRDRDFSIWIIRNIS